MPNVWTIVPSALLGSYGTLVFRCSDASTLHALCLWVGLAGSALFRPGHRMECVAARRSLRLVPGSRFLYPAFALPPSSAGRRCVRDRAEATTSNSVAALGAPLAVNGHSL